MAPLVLEGDTLGKKHQCYNKLLKEIPNTTQLKEPSQEDDIQSLINIEIAAKNRNVEYILNVLKSEDQLYVSKAIKRSIWLITDPQYAHIINPEHLHKELYPQMTSRAFQKLLLNIRLHLKDPERVEAFYNYFKEKDIKIAYKWLQHCSLPFLEVEVGKHNRNIPQHLSHRLFKKHFSLFEIYTKKWNWIVEDSLYLLRTHTETFLDLFESLDSMKTSFYFNIGAKETKAVMNQCPQRILDKFEFYGKKLHTETFAKYLSKTQDVKAFLLKYVNNEKFQWLYSYDKIQHFIKFIPKEGRFEFIKKILINKDTAPSRDDYEDDGMDCGFKLCSLSINNTNANAYQWYRFAPFDTAFTDLKKLIRAESSPAVRNSMLQILLTCAGKNMHHIHTLLKYYYEKHINEAFKFKIQFINSFISKVDTYLLDDQSWNMLNQLFHSMEVFVESENNVQYCIRAIIVRYVIRGEQIPEIIKTKFTFNTMKNYQYKLKTQKQKNAVFEYLLNYLITKNNTLNLNVESEFDEAVTLCESLLKLIKDWNREIKDYKYALDRIKELTKIKNEKKWSKDLVTLYNAKKSWRKVMFEESIAIFPTEKVCVNALKHDPGLLSRNKEQVLAICCNDKVSLRNFLRKMRIYWRDTLAKDWENTYVKRLDQPSGHKALIVGLCSLLSQEQIYDLLKKYAPSETKIDWNETDQLILSLRKQLAKNVHKTRLPPPLEGILLYAKGDYLQYAVPSINALLSQISPNKSRVYVPKLLDSPVSLQKFGVRCAFHKLPSEELKPMFLEIWNSTKNSSIRTVLFTHTYELLCKEKNASHINDIWDLLSRFIDKLTPDEDKLIYTKLGKVSDVPTSVKPQFFKKSYIFLNSLPPKCNCETIINNMQTDATDFIELLDDDFVVDVMLKKLFEKLTKEQYIYDNATVIATFILASKDEKTQMQRYEKSLSALLDKYLPFWEQVDEDEYRVRHHLKTVLEKLAERLSYTFEKKMQLPLKMFETLQTKLENALSYQKDYVLLTIWKLIVTFVKILDETKLVTTYYKIEAESEAISNEEKEKMYNDVHKQLAPLFSKACLQYLKEDLSRFGQSIYSLFARAFEMFFDDYLRSSVCRTENQIGYLMCMLQSDDDKSVWLMVHRVLVDTLTNIYTDAEKDKVQELRQLVFSHPSDEIKMHYYELFDEIVPRKIVS